jgi:hypothetical protein
VEGVRTNATGRLDGSQRRGGAVGWSGVAAGLGAGPPVALPIHAVARGRTLLGGVRACATVAAAHRSRGQGASLRPGMSLLVRLNAGAGQRGHGRSGRTLARRALPREGRGVPDG